MSTDLIVHPLLGQALALHPQVAVRPEPFGALAYHYGNRRLVFLQHVDMVTVASALAAHPSLADALRACAIDAARWPSFAKAFASLLESEVVVVRDGGEEANR
ncbi:MAG: mycofactocin biosynthesis chaperone MftB [Ilumatobacteraceae bacterium]